MYNRTQLMWNTLKNSIRSICTVFCIKQIIILLLLFFILNNSPLIFILIIIIIILRLHASMAACNVWRSLRPWTARRTAGPTTSWPVLKLKKNKSQHSVPPKLLNKRTIVLLGNSLYVLNIVCVLPFVVICIIFLWIKFIYYFFA